MRLLQILTVQRTRSSRGSKLVSASVSAAELLERRTLLTAYVVDTLSDEVAADGRVSFREAITAANTNQAVNEAGAGESGTSDSIQFAPSLSGQTILIRGPQLAIRDDLVIDGGDDLPVTLDGNGNRQVLAVATGVTATIRSIHVTGGYGSFSSAGGILNGGHLTLIDCKIDGNTSTTAGGGIASGGVLVLKRCTVTNNTAINYAAISSSGQLIIEDSTISGNVATSTLGGIYLFQGSLFISNSTISGNRSKEAGTGVAIGSGTATLRNVTVFGNYATSSAHQLGFQGGVYVGRGAALLLQNSIVAGNSEDDAATTSTQLELSMLPVRTT